MSDCLGKRESTSLGERWFPIVRIPRLLLRGGRPFSFRVRPPEK